ncbi:Undecaprenyl phosphate-aminoarabinose flippase subunit ArnF [Serratia entomophila]|jgi:undecaprenyl phosphate-alpha-L-ara4N flippase subunit ArnF|uniref:Probable 4-amino-4-deoxy-L-arabinose-phosphoundecaprenol flippase subunit ArnF n=1 Tax=Serratia entomophila TaxID=42906 RepID=A0ABY5CZE5_9GAMM|nr:4-amino-4-deoxy-L-arabinose-phosphoundecaprenol flippase subunit ArnF [Serratia entomophila]UIW20413.1 4-amino-4-deoxy-L-arabinose-phosphoundecaprenol flippase subunit ArnF [Serratia entomophila]USV02915.1 4-amino-4-deoxy-L-arabinose-phosphoundecaprenol flippase subunit ArnF [Serratia entomophila]CAI0701593.1 Undecaprenyl phosphate-aminoarabinose flippase subunit ArnF [Serratia entomophila]CAI0710135.1 Undecaprenyl phosphate-aminoarabinose flippase subunit ArnF [Serratia entomophila]CAI0739
MKGYAWGCASVLLVTLAQLLMKWGMAQIPLMSFADVTPALLGDYGLPLLAVSGGIFGYALSMLCWFFALRYLPLNRAYPLLSLSYALVYLAAVILPWFNESATLLKSLGTLFILFGVLLINSKPASKTPE